MAHGLPAATAGERIADQVESDAFFIFTNGPDEAEVLDDWRKVDELIAARNWHVTMLACNFRQSWTARRGFSRAAGIMCAPSWTAAAHRPALPT
jgi:hypothetical protein